MTNTTGGLEIASDDNDGFHFKREVQVRFRDLDVMNHVNNATYITYFEIAHVAFWFELTGGADDARAYGLVIAEIACAFRSPARYDEWLDVWIKPTALGRSRVEYAYRINAREDGRIIATGRSAQVLYDHAGGRSRPLPPDLRARFEAAAGRPLGPTLGG